MRKRIMVVEDDVPILQLMHDILALEGYEVVGVRHPDHALGAARQHDPDLFLIDIMLPQRSGIEVADELSASGFVDVPMIAMSASLIMRDLALHSGVFQATVGKPFDLIALLGLVEDTLSSRPVRDLSHS